MLPLIAGALAAKEALGGGGGVGEAIGTSIKGPGNAPRYGDLGTDPAESSALRERDRYRGMGYTNYQGIGNVGQEQRDRAANAYGQSNDSRARQMGSIQDMSSSLRGQRSSIANQLIGMNEYGAAMRGDRPSVAQAQMQMGLDQAVRNQMAMAASARGGGANLAAAQAAGARAGSDMQLQGIGQSTALRAQEIDAARAGYMNAAQGVTGSYGQLSQGYGAMGQQLAGMRGQDLGAMQASDQMALAQRDSAFKDEAMRMQNQQFYEGLGHDVNRSQQQAEMTRMGYGQQINMAEAQNRQNMFSGVMNMGSGLASMFSSLSDPAVKTGLSPASTSAASAFGDAAGSPGTASGMAIGNTAQSSGLAAASAPEPKNPKPPQPSSGNKMGPAPPIPEVAIPQSIGSVVAPTIDMSQLGSYGYQPVNFTSDPSAKSRPTEGKGIADAFLNTLTNSAASYNYTDPRYEPRSQPTGGKYLGVMADQLEEVPGIGHQLVSRDPQGLRQVENPAMVSALAAGLGRLNEKVEAMGKGKRRK